MAFTGVTYYDGIGFLTHDKAGLKSAKELDGATVCIQAGTDTELNVADYFKANNMKYTPVTFDRSDESAKALESGRCDTLASDQSQLYALRIKLSNPAEWIVLPEVISKEPLGPVVRRGDDEWFSIVRWTLFAMLNAEEMGINSQNVDEKAANPATPDMAHLLGKEGDYGKDLKLDNKWAYNIIKQVGNYSEIFERNVGSESPLKIKRGQNNLWNNGGIQYAPPALSRCEVTSVATAALSSALCFPRFLCLIAAQPLKAHSLLPTLRFAPGYSRSLPLLLLSALLVGYFTTL